MCLSEEPKWIGYWIGFIPHIGTSSVTTFARSCEEEFLSEGGPSEEAQLAAPRELQEPPARNPNWSFDATEEGSVADGPNTSGSDRRKGEASAAVHLKV